MRPNRLRYPRIHAASAAVLALSLTMLTVAPANAEPSRPTTAKPSASSRQGISIAANADGRLEVFCACPDGGPLQHTYQRWPNGPWSPLVPLVSGSFHEAPSVSFNADGRLELFHTTAQGPGHAYQLWPNGPWSAFTALDDGGATAHPPAVSRNADGRLEIFFQRAATNGQPNQNAAFLHSWQEHPNATWSPSFLMNDYPSYGPLAPMTAYAMANGRLQLVVPSGSGNFAVVTQQSDGTWPLTPLGKVPPAGYVMPPVPDEIVLDWAGYPVHFATTPASGQAPPTIWSNDASLDGGWAQYWLNREPTGATDHVSVGKNGDGRLELIWVDLSDGRAWHLWEHARAGGGFDVALPLSSVGGLSRALGVATNPDGRLEAFFSTPSGGLAHSYQMEPGIGPWSTVTALT